MNADRAESAAWQFLLDVVSERDKLYLRLKEAQALALEKVAPQRDQLESVKAMLAEAEVEAEHTAREMRDIPESRRNGPTYKALEKQGREIDERYAGLEKVRNKLEAEIAAATITDDSIANFTAFSEDAIAGLSNPDYAIKRHWLDYLKVKVEVGNKIATVSCMLPIESRSFDLRTASGMTSITSLSIRATAAAVIAPIPVIRMSYAINFVPKVTQEAPHIPIQHRQQAQPHTDQNHLPCFGGRNPGHRNEVVRG